MAAGRARSEELALTAEVVVIFGFAVADGLLPVVGAAPYEVLGRQLPRQLVQMLNGGADRGVRFLPYLTSTNGQRMFLRVRELLPVSTLASLHQRGEVQLLVDGLVTADTLKLRAHHGTTQQLLLDIDIPFRADKPAEALSRMWFELTGVLGWSEKMAPLPVTGPALSWWLVAKDELLTLEAGMQPQADADVLRPAREAIALADVAVVHDVAFETSIVLLRAGKRREQVADMLALLGRSTQRLLSMRRAAALLQAAGDERAAAELLMLVLQRERLPADVESCAAMWFRLGELQLAHEALQAAHQAGELAPAGLAQLAAVADRLGDAALRDRITDQLTKVADLPAPVARLVGSFLVEGDRVAEAHALLKRAAHAYPGDSGLWLDLGRACLMLDRPEEARDALQSAATNAGAGESRRDIERLLRLSKVPGLFAGMRNVDTLLAKGDARWALRQAREVVRRSEHAAEAWLFLGVVRQKLRQERRAESALRRALALDQDLAEAHNRLGILLVGRGDIEKGHEHLVRAVQLAPTDPSAQLHLAQACVLLGRRADAEEHLRTAQDLGARPEMLDAVRRAFFAA